MSRRAARITHDEVRRMVKAVRDCGLSIGRVSFDGDRIDIVIGSGEIVDTTPAPAGQPPKVVPLLREPKL